MAKKKPVLASSSGNVTPEDFAKSLLVAIKAPVTATNISFIEAWENKEGGNWNNTAKYNPLNTTLKEPGSTDFAPGKSVQAYTSWAEGLKATVSTIEESQYSSVVSALRKGNTQAALSALKASPWDAGHYAGWNPATTVGKDITKLNATSKANIDAATKALVKVGISGKQLLLDVAELGQRSGGTYKPTSALSHWAASVKQQGSGYYKTLGKSYNFDIYAGQATAAIQDVTGKHAYTLTTSDYKSLGVVKEDSLLKTTVDTLQQEGADVGHAITSVPDFLSLLTKSSTWIKVGLVVAALALVIVGLVKMMGVSVPTPMGPIKAGGDE